MEKYSFLESVYYNGKKHSDDIWNKKHPKNNTKKLESETNFTIKEIKKWKETNDPKYQKYLEYCKSRNINPVV